MILLRAYIRRKRFEARMVAAEMSKLLGGASAGSATGAGRGSASAGRVSPDAMLAMMGVSL